MDYTSPGPPSPHNPAQSRSHTLNVAPAARPAPLTPRAPRRREGWAHTCLWLDTTLRESTREELYGSPGRSGPLNAWKDNARSKEVVPRRCKEGRNALVRAAHAKATSVVFVAKPQGDAQVHILLSLLKTGHVLCISSPPWGDLSSARQV